MVSTGKHSLNPCLLCVYVSGAFHVTDIGNGLEFAYLLNVSDQSLLHQ